MGGREEGLGGTVLGVDTVPSSKLVPTGIDGGATGTVRGTGLGMSESRIGGTAETGSSGVDIACTVRFTEL